MNEYHNPHNAESAEQIAYEQEMLAHQFGGIQTQDFDANSGTLDRGFGGGSAKGGSLGDKFNGLVKNIKPGIQATKAFFTLDSKISKDIYDVNLFPEVAHTAVVRKGPQLCPEEQAFLQARKINARDNFARYMGWDPSAVHPDDVPTIGFGGSGGGYRAMLGLLGYSRAFRDAGLWDSLTYVAGVSGSCWTLGALYTFGEFNMDKLVEHCKKRLSPHHPLSPDAVSLLLSTSRGEYETIGPLITKQKSGLHTVAMDLYSVFTTGYLFLQSDPMLQPGGSAQSEVAGYHRAWWKWTHAQKYFANGSGPLPILTAIRHERPWKDWADAEHPFADANPTSSEQSDAQDAWFQWYEMTPFEVGCDELEAWCPTFGFGRTFEEGRSVQQLPEQSLALLLGLCTSAPAGPLTSYLSTIERNLPSGFIGNAINNLASGIAKMWGKQETAIFENHHPLHASNEHNFLFHYTPTPKGTPRPKGLENSPRIHLIDSGMDNNCPTMPLLNPAREVDVIINMDASSDVQKDSFEQRVQQIGSRRGLKFTRRRNIHAKEDPNDPDRFKGLYAQIYDGVLAPRPATVVDSYGKTVTNPPAPIVHQECTMVYLPLLPNERAVPGYDPSTAKFSGSYNLVWTPEQIDMILKCSAANYKDGEDTIKEALFNAWQRKTYLRQQREKGMAPAAPGGQPSQAVPQPGSSYGAQAEAVQLGGQPPSYLSGQPGVYPTEKPGASSSPNPQHTGYYGETSSGAPTAQPPAYSGGQPGAYPPDKPSSLPGPPPGPPPMGNSANQPPAYSSGQPGVYPTEKPGSYHVGQTSGNPPAGQTPSYPGVQPSGYQSGQGPSNPGSQSPGYPTGQPGAYASAQQGGPSQSQTGAYLGAQPAAYTPGGYSAGQSGGYAYGAPSGRTTPEPGNSSGGQSGGK